jgi:hypothetical protein|tara:strand:+ start:297 stop:521 length:225 start_codon:yes stop_codon:yes gene_type:complete
MDMIFQGCSINFFQASQRSVLMSSCDLKALFDNQFARMNGQIFSTGLSAGDRGGNGKSVIFAGISSLSVVCPPA